MGVELDRIEIMRGAEVAIRLWLQQLEGLGPLMKSDPGRLSLHTANGRLYGFLAWMHRAINYEKDFNKEGGQE